MAEWNIQDETKLLNAIRYNKPVGVNKHFAIVKIVDQLKNSLSRLVTIRDVWSYLESLYDVDALDEFETIPFPNEVTDFCLPEQEFPETISDLDSESDHKQSIADSLELDQPSAELPVNKNKGKLATKQLSEDNTPKRPSKRTRASAQISETPSVASKRRRV
ncbi:MRGBP [Bugula neritina]|uniref:MRGBP n=1 Tax=Bugula neritina TaxID=10212 RepID=A0A7J7K4A6_BUGNE|nr:MRGBP [Bugula neritina]